ncbi:exosortase A [Vibrio tritonius]|uniref:Exosortase A n=1 Tax=Vibrio tritonius TaxID=1435069 RepID=A0ABS7YQ69_9VIBR|nr:exosortase A [Vibrio tritonius]MCA2017122.1 exosortase A [Vibrio tritonius]
MIKKGILRFGLPLMAWGALFYPSLANMVGVWGQSKTYEHCYLIIPICIWLLWQKKDQLHQVSITTARLPAILLIFPLTLWVIGKVTNIAFFEHVAAITSLQLIIWSLIGTPATKNTLFVLCYLWFLIPFGEELVPFLQQITSDMSVFLIRLFGVPIYREGFYLTVPRGQFEVAEACSGIRFLIASLALGTLFSHVFFQKQWKFWSFVIFSFIFPIIANGLRVFGIIMIGNFIDMKYASGVDHLVYGWLFFSFITVCTFFIAYAMRDKALTTPPPTAVDTPTTPLQSRHVAQVHGIIILLIVIAYGWASVSAKTVVPDAVVVPAILPNNFHLISESPWKIHFPHADHTVMAIANNGTSEYFTAQYFKGRENAELISSINKFYSEDNWTLSQKRTVAVNQHEAQELSLVNTRGQYRTVIFWYRINQHYSANPLKIKLWELYYRLSRRPVISELEAFSSVYLNADDLNQSIAQSAMQPL